MTGKLVPLEEPIIAIDIHDREGNKIGEYRKQIWVYEESIGGE